MYNNRIFLIYYIFIAISYNNIVSSKIISSRRHNVCTALAKGTNPGIKNNLPNKKFEKIKRNLIKFNNCSVSKEVKQKLEEVGIDSELLKTLEDENEKKKIIDSIVDFVNLVYRENGYFNSYVDTWEYLESGELMIECVEKEIPECNFRLFVKDEESPKDVQFNLDKVIKTSASPLPMGKYSQIPNEYLVKKIMRGKRIVNLDPNCFESLRETRLYRNLQYVIHKENNEIFLDFFFDGYGIIHSVSPTLSLPPGGPYLNLVYKNIDLAKTKSVLNLVAELNLLRLLKYNHKVRLNLFSDIVDLSFWNHHCCNPGLFNLYSVISMNDVRALASNLGNLRFLRKLKSTFKGKKTNSSQNDLNQSQIGNLDSHPSPNLSNTLKDPQTDSINFKDFELCLRYLKILGNLKYVVSSSFGVKDVTLKNDFTYKLDTNLLKEPLLVQTTFVNTVNYDLARDLIALKPYVDHPSFKYRAQTKLDVTLDSKNKLNFKYLYGNKMYSGDYRGLFENLLSKPFFLFSHDFLIPITFNFKFVPYLGIFLDLLLPSGNDNVQDFDLSMGLKLMVLNLTVSIPLLTRFNSSFMVNRFSKETKNFHFTL